MNGQVLMRTVIQTHGVLYEAPSWSHFVPFGRSWDHRPAGLAFRQAAREQERRALESMQKDGGRQ